MRITPIPPDIRYTLKPYELKRVVVYVRISTNHPEQLSSLSTQDESLTDFVRKNPLWTLIKVYRDEGKSGTAIASRPAFSQMLDDARNHAFDIVVVKTISRFSRNTVDLLKVIRELNALGIEVFFAQERLSSSDPKIESVLSILAALAQEESRNLSENIKWGIKRKMEKGQFTLPYGRFLGYKKGIDGRPVIVKKEARIVRRIYQMFLDDISIHRIATILTKKQIPAPGGKGKWHYSTVRSILTNEKYKGVAYLQKTFTPDYLTHRAVVNNGEVAKYVANNSHPAIIDEETWEKVQEKLGGGSTAVLD